MAPPRVEEYVRKVFEGTKVKVDVVSDDAKLVKEYPLFSAVNRCAKGLKQYIFFYSVICDFFVCLLKFEVVCKFSSDLRGSSSSYMVFSTSSIGSKQ